jgi:hypothetical protein
MLALATNNMGCIKTPLIRQNAVQVLSGNAVAVLHFTSRVSDQYQRAKVTSK